jgi:hypothetical protein
MGWFGEKERKIPKLSKTTFTYRSSSYYFMLDILKNKSRGTVSPKSQRA